MILLRIVSLLSFMCNLALKREELYLETLVCLLLSDSLRCCLRVRLHIESKDSTIERSLIQRIAQVREVLIQLLHALQVRLSNVLRGASEEVRMCVLKKLLKLRLPGGP